MKFEDESKLIKELIGFERELAQGLLDEKVKPPIHFSRGNEKELINIFKDIKEEDWVCSTYRNHYHALLKGIPKDWLREEIAKGRSMQIMREDYKFVTSSIVGGILPIAVGIGMGIKRKKDPYKVWVFCGDMAAETGIFHECVKYVKRNNFPVNFIIEDNGLGVNTPTQKAWGQDYGEPLIIRYSYEAVFPHQGVGKEVGF